MSKRLLVVAFVLLPLCAFAQQPVNVQISGTAPATGEGVVDSTVQRVAIATDTQVAQDINLIQAATSSTADSLTTIVANMSFDATLDQTAKTKGPQLMLLGSSSTPTAVTSGNAVQMWADLNGRIHISTEKAEDSASANADLLTAIACVRDDTLDVRSGTEGDYEPCHTDVNGAIWTQDVKSNSMLTSLQQIDNLVIDPCAGTAQTFVPFSFSTATTTQLIAASSSNKNYICSINIVVGGADNVALVEDDTSACASPTAGLAGGTTAATGWNLAANGGLAFGNGKGTVFKTAATNVYTCLISSAAAQVSGTISYVQAP